MPVHMCHCLIVANYSLLILQITVGNIDCCKTERVDILISKNQALQIYPKHHDDVYKTP